MIAMAPRSLRIGVWAAGPRDDAGAWRQCEAAGAELVRALRNANSEDEALLVVTERGRFADVPAFETGPIPAYVPGLLHRAVSFLWSLKRLAGNLWRGPSRSALDWLWLLLLLPIALPVYLFDKLGRRLPALRAMWSWLVGLPPSVPVPAGADWDVWVVLSPSTACPFPDGVRAVWLLDGPPAKEPQPPPAWALEKAIALLESQRLFSLFAVQDVRCLDHPDLIPYPNIRARYRKLP